jgi:hypothetical protein
VDVGQRAAIENVVKRDGKVAVWVYAPGFVGETLSDEGVSSLTGIKVAHLDGPQALRVKITDAGDALVKDAPQAVVWGDDAKIAPVFYCTDESAKALGVLDGVGRTGLAVRRFPEWTSVYCAAPNLPAWLLRDIAKCAGVHIFNEADDVLYANRSFLGIHTNEAGPRVLRFARPTSLYEVFEKRQVATDAIEVKVELPARHTAFYFLGTGEQWEGASRER